MSDLRTFTKCAAMAAGILVYGAGTREAGATTPNPTSSQVRLCLKANMTGLIDLGDGNRGTAEHFSLRGIRYELERNGSFVTRGEADPDDGCFLAPAPTSSGQYEVFFLPVSNTLHDGNELQVRNLNDMFSWYEVNFTLTAGGARTIDIQYAQDLVIPRMYAVFAYAIYRFRGRYQNQLLTVWNGSSPTCDANRYCGTEPNYEGLHIAIGSSNRKFVMAHEYGHAAMYGAGASGSSDCSYGGNEHGMKGVERASCAASEGWANFVAADVFNHETSAAPELRYWNGPTGSLVNVETGDPFDNATDDCDGWPSRFTERCRTESRPGYGVELDWMRFLWDYHQDADAPRNHDQMQDAFIDASGWSGTTNIYARVRDQLAPKAQARWREIANDNGICDAGSTC